VLLSKDAGLDPGPVLAPALRSGQSASCTAPLETGPSPDGGLVGGVPAHFCPAGLPAAASTGPPVVCPERSGQASAEMSRGGA
jgi:hypothetical protein